MVVKALAFKIARFCWRNTEFQQNHLSQWIYLGKVNLLNVT